MQRNPWIFRQIGCISIRAFNRPYYGRRRKKVGNNWVKVSSAEDDAHFAIFLLLSLALNVLQIQFDGWLHNNGKRLYFLQNYNG